MGYSGGSWGIQGVHGVFEVVPGVFIGYLGGSSGDVHGVFWVVHGIYSGEVGGGSMGYLGGSWVIRGRGLHGVFVGAPLGILGYLVKV